jgi:hypothetical protein
MTVYHWRGIRPVISAFLAVLLAIGMPFASPAIAENCPGPSVGGKTIGWVEFDDIQVPLKRFTYPAGGVLDPPGSAAVAGVSARHRPLLSDTGTTVLAWHLRYGQGCNGALNPILKKRVGEKFDIVTLNGNRQTFSIVERADVARGQYLPEWFRTNGPRQVSLFTCSKLRNGRFVNTQALFAVPVN